MTSLGDEICLYLQDQPTLNLNFSNPGSVNLFSSLLPDKPELAVAVIERGGLPTVMWLTGSPGASTARNNESHLDQPVVQVFTRASMTGYNAGNTLMQGVFGALQGIVETIINPPDGGLFHLIASMQSPMYLGRDLKERHQWSQNYSIQWENNQR